jgi:hypothetical protein
VLLIEIDNEISVEPNVGISELVVFFNSTSIKTPTHFPSTSFIKKQFGISVVNYPFYSFYTRHDRGPGGYHV